MSVSFSLCLFSCLMSSRFCFVLRHNYEKPTPPRAPAPMRASSNHCTKLDEGTWSTSIRQRNTIMRPSASKRLTEEGDSLTNNTQRWDVQGVPCTDSFLRAFRAASRFFWISSVCSSVSGLFCPPDVKSTTTSARFRTTLRENLASQKHDHTRRQHPSPHSNNQLCYHDPAPHVGYMLRCNDRTPTRRKCYHS